MEDRLIITLCSFLIPEVSYIIKNGDYPEIKLVSFKASCTSDAMDQNRLSQILADAQQTNSNVILVGGICQSPQKKYADNIQVIQLEQCFELFINRETVAHYISQGYYIVTNGWLKSLDYHIKKWGFEKENAQLFFQESIKGILFLDTYLPGEYLTNLKSLSEYMGLPYTILPVGLSHCQKFIDSLVYEWRHHFGQETLTLKLSKLSRHIADYSLINNQLEELVKLTVEDQIIQKGFELLNLLYAPSYLKYYKYLNEDVECIKYGNYTESETTLEGHNFKIDIFNSKILIGFYEVIGFKFPQYEQEYLKTGTLISRLFSLSIANARKFKTILAQKDQLEINAKELEEHNLAKDKLFSIISHDLRGPFNTLIGFSDLLIEDIENNNYNEIQKFSKNINKIAKQTFELLENLLEWSRTQTGTLQFNKQEIKFYELTSDVIDTLQSQIEGKKLTISINIPLDLIIQGDKNMLKTILRNLISNAIKFSFNDGEITISNPPNNHAIQISVSDNGVGIGPETISELFHLKHNKSTKGTSEEVGTGLGLILCKDFIQRHNGEIWVESIKGKGSTFNFTVPNL